MPTTPACLRTLLALLALTLAARGQGNLIIVDDGPCPGADFATIQAAVDAAQDDDTILVHGSTGAPFAPFVVEGKDLRLVAFGDVQIDASAPVELRDTDPDREILLRGFTSTRPLVVQHCKGPVWIEDCRFGGAAASTPEPGASFDDCGAVTLVRATFRGGDAMPDGSAAAEAGVIAHDVALLQIWNGLVTGGRGALFDATSADGGHGLTAGGATVVALHAADLRGGDGATSADAGATQPGSDGGDGLRADAGVTVLRYDSSLSGGAPGTSDAGDGKPGRPLAGSAVVLELPGEARVFSVEPAVVLEGHPAFVHVETVPGDHAILWAGTFQLPMLLPALGGTLSTILWYVADLGVLPGGPLDLQPVLAEGLAGPDSVLPLHAQLGFLNGTQKVLSPPSLYVVADEHFFEDLGCP
ncbi:MAG: hypothetical protein H6825_00445 [Planctomycetes bacterium]|nr:hypothetical protein [Planctomycetota bacterium]